MGFGLLRLLAACGSTTAAAADDAGDAGDGGDAGAAAEPDSATCDLSVNLLDRVPDAGIADGASTTGLCLGCANANCGSTIGECDQSCDCKTSVAAGLDCYVKNSAQPTLCVASFAQGNVDTKVQLLGFQLIQCLQASCPVECATDDFSKDGSVKDPDSGANP